MKKYIAATNLLLLISLVLSGIYYFHKNNSLKGALESLPLNTNISCNAEEDLLKLESFFNSKNLGYTVKQINSNDYIIDIQSGDHYKLKDVDSLIVNLKCLSLFSVLLENNSSKIVLHEKK